MTYTEAFEKLYGREPEGTAFTPYRVCPLGAHCDHQLGIITGLALDRGIACAYRGREDGTVSVASLQFEKRVSFMLSDVPPKQNDWADYLRGAVLSLERRVPLSVGIEAVVDGSLPIGGLSSSAALIISFMTALCRLNGVSLTERELILAAQEAENRYVGVACGKLDQSCEVYCRKDHLLYMDMLDDTFERIPTPAGMKPYRIAILFSGVERSLVGSGYGTRVDECRSAAYALQAYAGLPARRFDETFLRQVPVEVFEAYRDRLPDTWRRRAEHWYAETGRVEAGVEAWKRGDLREFGRLVFESGRSSIELWETGSPELIRLYGIMTETDGIYGGRFSGAGFKGCCMALVDPDAEEEVERQVRTRYSAAFPELAGRFSVCFCDSADGVRA